jgi:uncharacterized protein YggU (UPF0235/DUF167 family)
MSVTITLTVQVKPGSSKGPLVVPSTDGPFTVYLQQRAVDGAANDALVRLLGKHFGVAKSNVTIIRGHTSKIKHVRIESVSDLIARA